MPTLLCRRLPLTGFPILLLLLALGAQPAEADEVVLKNGRSIRGTVLRQDDREIVIRLDDGQKLKLARAMVKRVKTTKATGEDPAPRAAQPVLLRWAMKPGQAVKFRARFKLESKTVKAPPASLGLKEWTSDYTLTCVEARVDDLTLELLIERSQERNVDKAGKETTLDSKAADRADQPRDVSMIGKTIRFHLSRRGEVTKLVRVAEMQIAKLPAKQQRLLEKAIGTYLLRFNLMGLAGVFPKRPALPRRERWSDSIVLSDTPMGDLKVGVTNTLERAGGGEAVIRQTGKLELLGMQKRSMTSSKVRGRIRMSTRDGCLLEVKQTSTGRFTYGEGKAAVDVDMILAGTVRRR